MWCSERPFFKWPHLRSIILWVWFHFICNVLQTSIHTDPAPTQRVLSLCLLLSNLQCVLGLILGSLRSVVTQWSPQWSANGHREAGGLDYGWTHNDVQSCPVGICVNELLCWCNCNRKIDEADRDAWWSANTVGSLFFLPLPD